ncbi:MAG: hypothetical protein R2684_00965 [Pyrinomonadaceae bacterium]
MSFNKEKAMRNAERFLTQGKISAAISEYKQITENDPRDVNTLNTLGDLYAKSNDKQEAVKCYMRVAEYYSKQGFAKKAIAIYNKVHRIEPDSADISKQLAELYTLRGSYAEARLHFEKLAAYYEKLGQKDEALEVWVKIGEIDPNNSEIYLKIAEAYWSSTRAEQACDAYVEAGKRLAAAGKGEASIAAFSRALEIDETNVVAMEGLVRQQILAGFPEEAAKVLERRLESEPFDKETNFLLVDCYYDIGDAASAEKIIVKMVEREPSNYPKFLDLIGFYLKADDLDSAVRSLSMITEHMLVGGESESLFSIIDEILKRNPEHIGALRLLARYHGWLKDDAELKTVLERIAESARNEGQTEDELSALNQLRLIAPYDQNVLARLSELGATPEPVQTQQEEELPLVAEAIAIEEGHPEAVIGGFEFESGNGDGYVAEPVNDSVEASVDQMFYSDQTPVPHTGFEATNGFDYATPTTDVGQVENDVPGIEESSDFGVSLDDGQTEDSSFSYEHTEQQEFAYEVEQENQEISESESVTRLEEPVEDTAHQVEAHTAIVSDDYPAAEDFENDGTSELSPADELRLEESIESIRFYIDQGYSGLAEKSLGDCIKEFGNLAVLEELSKMLIGGADSESGTEEPLQEFAEGEDTEVDSGYSADSQDPGVSEGYGESFDIAEETEVSEPAADLVEVAEAEEVRETGFEFTVHVDEAVEEEPASEVEEDSEPSLEMTEQQSFESDAELEDSPENPSEIEAHNDGTVAESFDLSADDDIEPEEQDLGAISSMDEIEPESMEAAINAATDSAPEPENVEGRLETAREFDGVQSTDDEGVDETAFYNSYENFRDQLELDESDENDDEEFDNHYHHAVAYKEMGLLEDAIRGFQEAVAVISPSDRNKRYLSCCTLLGHCFIEKGMPNLAVVWFKKAFEQTGMSQDETNGLRYELAHAYDSSGMIDEALEEYEQIYAIDVDYLDVSEKMGHLRDLVGSGAI